jgi:hypothetical protein
VATATADMMTVARITPICRQGLPTAARETAAKLIDVKRRTSAPYMPLSTQSGHFKPAHNRHPSD